MQNAIKNTPEKESAIKAVGQFILDAPGDELKKVFDTRTEEGAELLEKFAPFANEEEVRKLQN